MVRSLHFVKDSRSLPLSGGCCGSLEARAKEPRMEIWTQRLRWDAEEEYLRAREAVLGSFLEPAAKRAAPQDCPDGSGKLVSGRKLGGKASSCDHFSGFCTLIASEVDLERKQGSNRSPLQDTAERGEAAPCWRQANVLEHGLCGRLLRAVIRKLSLRGLKKAIRLSEFHYHVVLSHISGQRAAELLEAVGRGFAVLDLGKLLSACLNSVNVVAGGSATLRWQGSIRPPGNAPGEKVRVLSADFDSSCGTLHVLVRACPRLVPVGGSGGVSGRLQAVAWRHFVMSTRIAGGQGSLAAVAEVCVPPGGVGAVHAHDGGFTLESGTELTVYDSATLERLAVYRCEDLKRCLANGRGLTPDPAPRGHPVSRSREREVLLPLSRDLIRDALEEPLPAVAERRQALLRYCDGRLLVARPGVPPYLLNQIYGRESAGATWYDVQSGGPASGGAEGAQTVVSTHPRDGIAVLTRGTVCSCGFSGRSVELSILAELERRRTEVLFSATSSDSLAVLYSDCSLCCVPLRKLRGPAAQKRPASAAAAIQICGDGELLCPVGLVAVRSPVSPESLFVVETRESRRSGAKHSGPQRVRLSFVDFSSDKGSPSLLGQVCLDDSHPAFGGSAGCGSMSTAEPLNLSTAGNCTPEAVTPVSKSALLGKSVLSALNMASLVGNAAASSSVRPLACSSPPGTCPSLECRGEKQSKAAEKPESGTPPRAGGLSGSESGHARSLACAWLEPLTGSIVLYFAGGGCMAVEQGDLFRPRSLLQRASASDPANRSLERSVFRVEAGSGAETTAPEHAGFSFHHNGSNGGPPCLPHAPPLRSVALKGRPPIRFFSQLPDATLFVSPAGAVSCVSTGAPFWR